MRRFFPILGFLVLSAACLAQDSSTFFTAKQLPPSGGDITIPDNMLLPPNTKVTKTWLVVDDGLEEWVGRRLQRQKATLGLEIPLFVKMPNTSPGKVIKVTTSDHRTHEVKGGCLISVTFTTPSTEGDYSATYKMVDKNGTLLFPGKQGVTVNFTVSKKAKAG